METGRVSTVRRSLRAIAVLCVIGCGEATQPAGQKPPAVTPPLTPLTASGLEQVFTANADGSGITRLTWGSRPAWSSDGRRIAFQRNGEVRVINADGSGDVHVAAGSSPSWSPDNARLVFTNIAGISVTDIDGSAVKTLVRHNFRDDTYKPWDMGVGKPVWSPDGAYIAFEHAGDGDISPAQVFVMRADGSELRRLNVFPDGRQYAESDPSWSPDGARLVFWSWGYGIAITDRQGGSPNVVFAAFPEVAYGSKPVFLPDGRTVAFNRGRFTRGETSIWTVLGEWSSAKVLISNGYDAVWSPDGKRVAFVSTRVP